MNTYISADDTPHILRSQVPVSYTHLSKLAAGYAGKMEIITGVNLPALVEAVNCQEDGSSMETVIPQIKEAAVMKTLREILSEEESGDDDE